LIGCPEVLAAIKTTSYNQHLVVITKSREEWRIGPKKIKSKTLHNGQ
jgi:hypothetical protein